MGWYLDGVLPTNIASALVTLRHEFLDVLGKELLDHLEVRGPATVNFKFQTLALGLCALKLVLSSGKSLVEGLLSGLKADNLGF